jgi:quercetin dioxygenase-like cupin family protein
MAKFKIVRPDSLEFVKGRDLAPSDVEAKAPDPELDQTYVKNYHPGAEDELQLFEVRVDPGAAISSHAHAHDEIMMVLEGEMHFGSQVCTPGTTVYIPGHTLYSWSAGPEGLRFLNFRGAADYTYITKADLVGSRKERSPAAQ